MASTDVNLPIGHTPVFPDRCIACGKKHPKTSVTISSRSLGPIWFVGVGYFGTKFAVEVPACRACGRRLRSRRRNRLVFTWGLAILGTGLFVLVLPHYEGAWRYGILLGIALLCFLPSFLGKLFALSPVDI